MNLLVRECLLKIEVIGKVQWAAVLFLAGDGVDASLWRALADEGPNAVPALCAESGDWNGYCADESEESVVDDVTGSAEGGLIFFATSSGVSRKSILLLGSEELILPPASPGTILFIRCARWR